MSIDSPKLILLQSLFLQAAKPYNIIHCARPVFFVHLMRLFSGLNLLERIAFYSIKFSSL